MRFGQAFKSYWKNYANFKGRARSSEVWWMALWNFLILLPIILYFILWPIAFILTISTINESLIWILIDTFGAVVAYVLMYITVTFIPNLSLLLRCFHDIGQRGIVPISLFAITFILNSALFLYIGGSGLFSLHAYSTTSIAESGTITLVVDILGMIAQCLSFIMFIYFIVIACLDSKKGRNKYGESTKYPSAQYGDDSKLSIF